MTPTVREEPPLAHCERKSKVWLYIANKPILCEGHVRHDGQTWTEAQLEEIANLINGVTK